MATVNQERYQNLFKSLLQEGILFPPSPFETIFISAVHTENDLAKTLRILEKAIKTAQ